MPELPEVEVTRRGIAAPLQGALIQALHLGKPLRWPLGREPASFTGLGLGLASRRGKYIWLPLLGSEASPAGGLLLHLGMSGSLAWLPAGTPTGPPGPHDHFELVTNRGHLRLNDPRRFGAVVYSAALDQAPAARLLERLGPEPFDPALTPASFHATLQRHRTPVKTLLLSGEAVVGAGNIYACEALFAARIHPLQRSDRISLPRARRLLAALRSTLARALQLGGSSLRDFSDVHGVGGAYQAQAAVYGRQGQPCPNCAAPVRRLVLGQRSTYFCARCQKP